VRLPHGGGGYSELVIADEARAYPIPSALSFAEATVVTRHFPAAFSLANAAVIREGEWVLVMGAAGALGSAAVQVAKLYGAQVIAAAGSVARAESALALGADACVDYRGTDLRVEVMRITEGRGVNVVMENIADPELWSGAFNSLAYGGRLVTVGAHGGGIVPLDVFRLYNQRLQVLSGLGQKPAPTMWRGRSTFGGWHLPRRGAPHPAA